MPDKHKETTGETARRLVDQAEVGTREKLDNVHESLSKAMTTMTAKEYGQLINSMKDTNALDQSKNSHLPSLEFYDSANKGQVDAVRPVYDGDFSKIDRLESTYKNSPDFKHGEGSPAEMQQLPHGLPAPSDAPPPQSAQPQQLQNNLG